MELELAVQCPGFIVLFVLLFFSRFQESGFRYWTAFQFSISQMPFTFTVLRPIIWCLFLIEYGVSLFACFYKNSTPLNLNLDCLLGAVWLWWEYYVNNEQEAPHRGLNILYIILQCGLFLLASLAGNTLNLFLVNAMIYYIQHQYQEKSNYRTLSWKIAVFLFMCWVFLARSWFRSWWLRASPPVNLNSIAKSTVTGKKNPLLLILIWGSRRFTQRYSSG